MDEDALEEAGAEAAIEEREHDTVPLEDAFDEIEEDEIDERFSDPDVLDEDEYPDALEESTEDILGDDAAMKAEVDDDDVEAGDDELTIEELRARSAARRETLALARDLSDYSGPRLYLYTVQQTTGDVVIQDGPFRDDREVPVPEGQILGPLPD